MAGNDDKRFEQRMDRLSRRLPWVVGRCIHWLRRPASRLVRLPVGVALVLGGLLGFLPVLGFWMVPVGLLLLAEDLPFLRRPTRQGLAWAERRLIRWRIRRRQRTR
jgi:hypothetical protein